MIVWRKAEERKTRGGGRGNFHPTPPQWRSNCSPHCRTEETERGEAPGGSALTRSPSSDGGDGNHRGDGGDYD